MCLQNKKIKTNFLLKQIISEKTILKTTNHIKKIAKLYIKNV